MYVMNVCSLQLDGPFFLVSIYSYANLLVTFDFSPIPPTHAFFSGGVGGSAMKLLKAIRRLRSEVVPLSRTIATSGRAWGLKKR